MELSYNTEFIDFLKGFKVLASKIPKYELFKKSFNIKVDKALCSLILNADDEIIDPVIKASFINVFKKIENNGNLEIKYSQSYGMGRFYGNNSFVPLSRKIKHTVFHFMGWLDVDIRKAYPTIAVEIGRFTGEKFLYIEKYITDFDSIANELIEYYSVENGPSLTKDHIKTCFCSMMFGGGFDGWISKVKKGDAKKGIKPLNMKNIDKKDSFGNLIPHLLITEFKGDANRLIEIIYNANIPLVNKLTKKDEVMELWEKKNRVVSYFFQIVENHLLYLLYNFLVSKRIITQGICELEYDGLCIPPVPFDFDKKILEKDIKEMIFKKTSLNIDFVFKNHDASFIQYDIISDYNNNPTAIGEEVYHADVLGEDFVETTGVFSDKGAAEKIIELYPHFKNYEKTLYVFDDETGMWDSDSSIINKIIGKFSSHLHLLKTKTDKDGNEIIIKTDKSYGDTACLMKDMIVFLKSICIDKTWLDTARSSGLGKLLFLNGIYNCKTGVFTESFNPDIVFFANIPHKYEPFNFEDVAYMNDIKQRLFYASTSPTVGDYLILNLARGLAGDMASLKRFIFGIGPTNCGKGVITKALTGSCGGYVGGFNAENLIYKKFGNGDAAQGLRWAMLVCMCRIIISNEMDTKGDMNSNIIKKLSSGGDPLKGRFHGGNEQTFYTHFLSLALLNDMGKITPYDDAVDDRVKCIQYEKTFVETPQNNGELKRDDNINAELETPYFKRCFVGLLMIVYKKFIDGGCVENEPADVKIAKDMYVGEERSDIVSRFLNDYEITGVDGDYVKGADIETWIKRNNLGASLTKFGIAMNKYIKTNKIDNVVNKMKKIGGKCVKCWVGIKELDEYAPEPTNDDPYDGLVGEFDVDGIVNRVVEPDDCV